jgi:regulator of sirC expression with transglutaminase-like and TPR domain
MENTEIKALVSLLDDEDSEVFHHIENKILSIGDIMIPYLENEWEKNFNPLVQRRIEDLIHNLQFNSLQQKLKYWKDYEQDDLLKGMCLVAQYQYPDLDIRKVKESIEKVHYEAWLGHRPYSSPSEQVRNLNYIIFHKLSFSSNTQNFHAPGNSMLNVVLESHRGNPITLCVIYMLVAQKLNMPVFGVNLPNLFVLTYKSEDTQFYINVFNKGLMFSRTDIDDYLQKLKLEPKDMFYQPCLHKEILQRVLRNLILSFEKLGEPEKEEEVKKLLDVIS